MVSRQCRWGQATIEMSIAIFAVMVLVFGTVRVFFWLGERFVVRHKNYQATRLQAGSATQRDPYKEFEQPAPLDVFGEKTTQ